MINEQELILDYDIDFSSSPLICAFNFLLARKDPPAALSVSVTSLAINNGAENARAAVRRKGWHCSH